MTQPYSLHIGDCLDVLKTLDAESIDAIVTDPPYGLAFMGKRWDYDVPATDIWQECLRVLKPGGHLLAFAGTRTQHRMACRIEDAGFEIRDMIAWVYGSGFPKSLDVSKAIDKSAGAEREVVGQKIRGDVEKAKTSGVTIAAADANKNNKAIFGYGIENITAPATAEAKQWASWGTALKPALEPITMARKPLIGTVASNVLEHGTGALNIDGCRIATDDKLGGGAEKAQNAGKIHEGWQRPWMNDLKAAEAYAARIRENVTRSETLGRWPANLIHDGSDEVVRLFPVTTSGALNAGHKRGEGVSSWGGGGGIVKQNYGNDTGSAARFFYCPKASKAEREAGLEEMEEKEQKTLGNFRGTEDHSPKINIRSRNHHPTVKPIDLMAYLCRLITPPNGTILDPFMGSGSTGLAAIREGFKFIGIELNPEYAAIARKRIENELNKAPLFANA